MKINDLKDFKAKYKSDIFFDFDIKKLNWFNIDGKTKVFFKPKSLKELKDFLALYSNRGKIFILGLGSNVLFSDKLYNGLVIKLTSTFATLSKLNNGYLLITVPNEKGVFFILKRLLKPSQDELGAYRFSFRDYIYLLFNKTNKVERNKYKKFDYDHLIYDVRKYFDIVEGNGYPKYFFSIIFEFWSRHSC